MKIDLAGSELILSAGHPLRMSGAKGVTVLCTGGTLWITTSGLLEDIFLETGQTCRIGSNTLTLIESLGSGSIRLEVEPATPISQLWSICGQTRIAAPAIQHASVSERQHA